MRNLTCNFFPLSCDAYENAHEGGNEIVAPQNEDEN